MIRKFQKNVAMWLERRFLQDGMYSSSLSGNHDLQTFKTIILDNVNGMAGMLLFCKFLCGIDIYYTISNISVVPSHSHKTWHGITFNNKGS